MIEIMMTHRNTLYLACIYILNITDFLVLILISKSQGLIFVQNHKYYNDTLKHKIFQTHSNLMDQLERMKST